VKPLPQPSGHSVHHPENIVGAILRYEEHSIRVVAVVNNVFEGEECLVGNRMCESPIHVNNELFLLSTHSEQILQELVDRCPNQNTADQLTFYGGSNLAKNSPGEIDAIKLIFGLAEGRELVPGCAGNTTKQVVLPADGRLLGPSHWQARHGCLITQNSRSGWWDVRNNAVARPLRDKPERVD
jgi:hypothetical protein